MYMYFYCIIQSRSGFIAVCTSTLIIFGSYSSSMYPAVCVEAVEKLSKSVSKLPIIDGKLN